MDCIIYLFKFRISSLVVERMLRPWFHPDFLWNISPQGKRAKKIIDVLVNFTEKIIAGRRKLFKEIKESKESSDTESTFDGQDDDNDLCDKSKLRNFQMLNFEIEKK